MPSGSVPGDALILTKPIGTGVLFNAVRSGKLPYAEFEKESRIGETENRMSWYLTPGAKYHMSETTDVGFSVPVGLQGNTYDWGVMAKVMMEW